MATALISASPAILEQYFDVLEETLTEYDLMEKPNLIFNMDESGIPFEPKPPKCIFKKGEKRPVVFSSGNKGQFTIVGCVNAVGFCIPPMVIIDRKSLAPYLAQGEVPGTLYALSSNGWMDQELFDLWFKSHFLKYIPSCRPVILLMDGHRSHYNPATIEMAAQENIILFTLPPNTTHLSQPLDRSCFAPLKTSWRQVCHKFMRDNPGKVVSRFSFSALFNEAWCASMTPANITAGFKATGIYPFNRAALVPQPHQSMSTLSYLPLITPSHQERKKVVSFCEDSEFENEENELACINDDKDSLDDSFRLLNRKCSLSELLKYPPTIKPNSDKIPKSYCTRVLTSYENRQLLKQKEMEEEELASQKAERKALRENIKIDKENLGKGGKRAGDNDSGNTCNHDII
jgi:hypothetical protein